MKMNISSLHLTLLAAAIMSFSFMVPAEAGSAGRGHYRGRSHDKHRHHGYKYVKHPQKSVSISIGGIDFYYSNGNLYPKKRSYHHYHKPPVGTCLSRLPYGYKVVRLGHKEYYKHRDTYYVRTPRGYVVVGYPGHHDHSGVLISKGARDGYYYRGHSH